MTRPRRSVVPLIALLLATACASGGTIPSGRAYGPEVQAGLAQVRAVIAPFVNLDTAVAAGYARDVPRCYADLHHGAMGYHHVNRALMDAKVEVERPEILLYERRSDGSYALNGVEYIVPYSRWPRQAAPPRVFGLELKQADDLQLWYLHMWAWTVNTAGLFADWNPAVRCPPGTTS